MPKTIAPRESSMLLHPHKNDKDRGCAKSKGHESILREFQDAPVDKYMVQMLSKGLDVVHDSQSSKLDGPGPMRCKILRLTQSFFPVSGCCHSLLN